MYSPFNEDYLKTIIRNPGLVMTLEYGMFKSEYPKLEFVTPAVFRFIFLKSQIFALNLNKLLGIV